ncbi:hypothetical protein [Apilactobacillus kunkeei]|uniref:hypothetical protein n=1 Tax=Apilactobacillus kunkeei TaxID=148814 RepID=UPI001C8A67F4|nr:hypothetical protein [Apilactobacillus kunkeei]MBX8456269.1 hypothetical protein [Apilactobacillus kunkeei]
MNIDELDSYIKSNCKAYDIFIEKAREDQIDRNSKRKASKRFNDEKIERAAEKSWNEVIANFHEKLKSTSTLKKASPLTWKNFIAENEILESLEDSMAELDMSE